MNSQIIIQNKINYYKEKNNMNNLAVCVDNKNQNVTAKQTIDAICF